jgi:predicted DNA-binding transcriptional regulator AlpA
MPEQTITVATFAPALLTDEGLAHYLSIGVRSVWLLVSRGELPKPINVPGMRSKRWRREDVDEYVERWESSE